MASAIDATKPADGVPASKADLRANLSAAKSEIEALQAASGGLTDIYDVAAYGAVGDNSTDDTTAFQNAINAVPNQGGIVYVPPGIYRITSSLTIPAVTSGLAKPVSIIGAGYARGGGGTVTGAAGGASALRFTGTGACIDYSAGGDSGTEQLYNLAGVRISDLALWGDSGGTAYGLQFGSFSHTVVERVSCKNFTDGILLVDDVYYGTFRDCFLLDNTRHGLHMDPTLGTHSDDDEDGEWNGVTVWNCRISRNGDDGIHIDGHVGQPINVRGGWFEKNNGYAIDFGQATKWGVNGIYFENNNEDDTPPGGNIACRSWGALSSNDEQSYSIADCYFNCSGRSISLLDLDMQDHNGSSKCYVRLASNYVTTNNGTAAVIVSNATTGSLVLCAIGNNASNTSTPLFSGITDTNCAAIFCGGDGFAKYQNFSTIGTGNYNVVLPAFATPS